MRYAGRRRLRDQNDRSELFLCWPEVTPDFSDKEHGKSVHLYYSTVMRLVSSVLGKQIPALETQCVVATIVLAW